MRALDCPGEPTFRRRLIWGALLSSALVFGFAAQLMGLDESP